MPEREELEEVRSALRRLGYLNRGFERFLLQDALRGRRPWRTLLLLTVKVAMLTGLIIAGGLTFALAEINGNFATPLDLPVLFLHLFAPVTLVSAAGFVALCGVLVLVLRLYPVRHIETLSLGAAAAVGAAGLAVALWLARAALAEGSRTQLVAVALAAPIAAYLLVKLMHGGFLALAIRFTDRPPGRRFLSRRWMGAAVLATLILLLLPVMLSARHRPLPPPETLPMAPGDRVLLLAVDGVLPEELDYLLARGELPAMRRLASAGARLWAYPRRPEQPASFWTSVATGVVTPRHGVAALDSFLPAGMRTPLARTGPLRAYFRHLAVPLGLAEYRPLLASRRRAYAFWELASRGGAPVLAVDWWATFPAQPLPGLVLAHDAYHLLESGTAGVVSPESAAPELAALVRSLGAGKQDGEESRAVAAAMPPVAAAAVLERAVWPDLFYRQVFARAMGSKPRAAALYLAGLDVAAGGWRGGDLAFADLVRRELAGADRLLAPAAGGDGLGTIAVVVDPGRRREGGSGRVLFWRRQGCRGKAAGIQPEAVASGLLRALGLPQSAELPPPPAGCSWPAPPATVGGFGEPGRLQSKPGQGAQYLEDLKALGYL